MSLHGITTQKAKKVLTINSDTEVLQILEVNLKHANLEVFSAQSGEEALKKVHKEKPDIILLDPALPDIDGIELCQQLKEAESTHHIPVILIGAKNLRKGRIVKAINGADYSATESITDFKTNKVDENFIMELRQLADELQEHNDKVDSE